MRLLNVVRLAVAQCPQSAALPDATMQSPEEAHNIPEGHTEDVSWWDTLESLARRRNEPWRIELFARAMVEDDLAPGCISLKSLWEIGMMEADDFGLLSAFCDSALYVDGKAIVLLEPSEQATFQFETGDGIREVDLAYAITALVDAGLVNQARVQFDTTESVKLDHKSGPTRFDHFSPARQNGREGAIQVDAFGATDVAMDICRLYTPTHNIASDANFEAFKLLMRETAKEDPEKMGSVAFAKWAG